MNAARIGVTFALAVLLSSMPARADDSSLTVGFRLSEALQVQFPQIEGAPTGIAASVTGIAVPFRTATVEIAPSANGYASYSSATTSTTTASIGGGGFDAGVRFAFGWVGEGKSGPYASIYFAGSYLGLTGQYASGEKYSLKIVQAFSDMGIGYKLALSRTSRLDIFASGVHVGFLPASGQVVSLAAYPTLGVGMEW
jgi:hypothetical protein